MTDSEFTSQKKIPHAVECDNCERDTYMYERYCHRCGNDRWD